MSGGPFMLRHYQPDQDLCHLAQLLKEIEVYDHDREVTTEDSLREQLHRPGHVPELDCWVATSSEEPDRLIGYCVVFAQAPLRYTLYIVVHPHWRGYGLGSALLERVLARAHERSAERIVITVNEKNEASNSFVRKHGFSRAGSTWLLHASAAQTFAKPFWPAGFTVLPYSKLQDITRLVEVHNRCFSDMWGHVENEQEMTAEGLSSWVAVLNPAGIFVAFAPDNDVAGTCYALPADHAGPVDLVDTLGVSPIYRELKLQKPLLLTAMNWLRSQARKPAILQSFGDSEQTIALYRESGFTLEHHYLSYQRQLA